MLLIFFFRFCVCCFSLVLSNVMSASFQCTHIDPNEIYTNVEKKGMYDLVYSIVLWVRGSDWFAVSQLCRSVAAISTMPRRFLIFFYPWQTLSETRSREREREKKSFTFPLPILIIIAYAQDFPSQISCSHGIQNKKKRLLYNNWNLKNFVLFTSNDNNNKKNFFSSKR